jgi:hypothetical protein
VGEDSSAGKVDGFEIGVDYVAPVLLSGLEGGLDEPVPLTVDKDVYLPIGLNSLIDGFLDLF